VALKATRHLQTSGYVRLYQETQHYPYRCAFARHAFSFRVAMVTLFCSIPLTLLAELGSPCTYNEGEHVTM